MTIVYDSDEDIPPQRESSCLIGTEYEPPLCKDRELFVVVKGDDGFDLCAFKYASSESLTNLKVFEKLPTDFSTSFIKVGHYILMVCEVVSIYDLERRDFLPSSPQLNSPKSDPVLIAIGSKVYAFSKRLFSPFEEYMELSPLAEVLDTCACQEWVPLPTPPLPPFDPYEDDPYEEPCACIIAFAASETALFLSLASAFVDYEGYFSLMYDVVVEEWSSSVKPLPFYAEAKFFGDICYGIPCDDEHLCQSVCSYKLVKEHGTFHFVQLCLFSIPLGLVFDEKPYISSLIPLEHNVLCIIRAHFEGPFDVFRFRVDSLAVDVFKVVPLMVYERKKKGKEGEEKKGKEKELGKGEEEEDDYLKGVLRGPRGSSRLLWHKLYAQRSPIFAFVGNC